ncbi:MAG: methionyl-tRNA synthetase [Lasallia pustulata]|uniref:methionine--tRNA ligase n=1 Tax=Lasallia pustulata TaxID=136370 RepID=A0A5M8PKW1_9LECA|nr:MAG: methionyl-tRNA synthetase [Lasallia pustulata]
MAGHEEILPEKDQRNVLITSALPYVNNVPHLGNIVGSVLSADVFSRYSKARGRPTLFICGTDEYGTATETKALEEGVTPRELCDKYNKIHAEIYEWFEIGFDYFGRTSTRQQKDITQDIFRKLYKNGYFIERTSRQPYCEKHKAFLADRFIEGTCPKCGYDDARGDQCDACGSVDYEALDLKNARCKVDPEVTPVVRETKHIHLLLDKLQPRIEEWFEKASADGAWSRNGKIITESWLKQGLRDRGITRDLTWGTPVPLDVFTDEQDKEVFKSKVFYVWFDACIGYVSITANYTEQWEQWWKDPDNVQLYQFMGKDNVPFHTVIFPGSQMGTEDKWTMLNHLSTTEYLNYENGKFSKSRGVGVFGNNARDTGVPADVWRYYLLKNRPETGDTQFEWKYFIEANNSELLAKLGNFVNRVIKLVNSKIYNSVIPDYTAMHSDPMFDKVKQEVNQHLKQYTEDLESVSLKAGLQSAMHIAQAGNNFLQSNGFDNKLAANEPERAAAVTGIAINLIYLCASIFAPYLPATSKSILEQLQAPFLGIPDHWTGDDIKVGHKIGKAMYLFSQIEPKKEDEWRAMFGGTQAERLKKDEEAAKAAAKKAASKAKKAEKKTKKPEQKSVESTATDGAEPADPAKEPVDAVTDGMQQVTLPSS